MLAVYSPVLHVQYGPFDTDEVVQRCLDMLRDQDTDFDYNQYYVTDYDADFED